MPGRPGAAASAGGHRCCLLPVAPPAEQRHQDGGGRGGFAGHQGGHRGTALGRAQIGSGHVEVAYGEAAGAQRHEVGETGQARAVRGARLAGDRLGVLGDDAEVRACAVEPLDGLDQAAATASRARLRCRRRPARGR